MKYITRRFLRNDKGATAAAAALMALPLMATIGAAVDYSQAVTAKREIQAALDAGALAAATPSMAKESRKTRKAVAQETFKANCTSLVCTGLNPPRFIIEDDSVRGVMRAEVSTIFLSLISIDTIAVKLENEVATKRSNLEFHIAFDLSASMGVASTKSGRKKLEKATLPAYKRYAQLNQGCAFACHEREGWEPGGGSMADLARELNVEVRWDTVTRLAPVLFKAITKNSSDTVSIYSYAFSDEAINVAQATRNLQRLENTLTRDVIRSNGSNFAEMADTLRSKIGPAENGISKVVVLVTDGLNNIVAGRTRNIGRGPIDPAICDQFKRAGISVAVVNIEYVELTGDHWFENGDAPVRPFYDQLGPALEACSSGPDYYVEASSPGQIRKAFKTLAENILTSPPVLTQ